MIIFGLTILRNKHVKSYPNTSAKAQEAILLHTRGVQVRCCQEGRSLAWGHSRILVEKPMSILNRPYTVHSIDRSSCRGHRCCQEASSSPILSREAADTPQSRYQYPWNSIAYRHVNMHICIYIYIYLSCFEPQSRYHLCTWSQEASARTWCRRVPAAALGPRPGLPGSRLRTWCQPRGQQKWCPLL